MTDSERITNIERLLQEVHTLLKNGHRLAPPDPYIQASAVIELISRHFKISRHLLESPIRSEACVGPAGLPST